MLPAYDVVIPARNAANTLALTLRSLEAQSHRPDRVIVVDDRSSDGTSGVARAEGVDCVVGPASGLAMAQNVGLRSVTSPYVAFVDADDAWTSSAGQTLLEVLSSGSELAAVAGNAVEFGSSASQDVVLAACKAQSGTRRGQDAHPVTVRDLWNRNPLTKSATLFRTEAVLALGGYRPLPSCEDYDLLLRLVGAGWLISVIDLATCWRMISTSSMTADSQLMLDGELQALSRFHDSALRRAALPRASLQTRAWRAWLRCLARDARYHHSLRTSPPPPGLPEPLRALFIGLMTSRGGDLLARGWNRYRGAGSPLQ